MAFTPKIRSIQTPDLEGQVDDNLWRDIRVLARKKTKYYRSRDTEKVGPLEEFVNLLHQVEALMKQLTFKIIKYSPAIVTALAKEALTNPKKRQESIAKLKRLDQIYGTLQEDAASEKLMSIAIGNFANGKRKEVYPIMQNARAQLAQIMQREKMTKRQKKQGAEAELTTKQRQELMYKGKQPKKRFGFI